MANHDPLEAKDTHPSGETGTNGVQRKTSGPDAIAERPQVPREQMPVFVGLIVMMVLLLLALPLSSHPSLAQQGESYGLVAAWPVTLPQCNQSRIQSISQGADGLTYVLSSCVSGPSNNLMFTTVLRAYRIDGTVMLERDYPADGVAVNVDSAGDIYFLTSTKLQKYHQRNLIWQAVDSNGLAYPLTGATSLALDSARYVIVTDNTYPGRIIVFGSDGQYVRSWRGGGTPAGNFQQLRSVAVRATDNHVIVADGHFRYLLEFDENGTYIGTIPLREDRYPYGVTSSADGSLYVLVSGQLVLKYDAHNTYVTQFGGAGRESGLLLFAVDLAANDQNVMVAIPETQRVQVYRRGEGTPVIGQTPAPTATPNAPCPVYVEKQAAPATLILGETVRITLTIQGAPICNVGNKPTDVMLVMDRSGSMHDEGKINDARLAALTFLNLLDLRTIQVGLVTFNQDGYLDQPLTRNRVDVEASIEQIQPGGNTYLAAGIQVGTAELLSQRHVPGADRVLILLTDGRTDPPAPGDLDAAEQARRAGITIFTIGLGSDVDAAILQQIANTPQNYVFAPSGGDLQAIYERLAKVVQGTAATNLVIRDTLPASVRYVPGSGQPEPQVQDQVLIWNFENIPTGGVTMSYQVEPLVPGTYGANVQAQAVYQNSQGQPAGAIFPVPQLQVIGPTPTATPTATATSTPAPSPTPTATPVPTIRPGPVYLPQVLRGHDTCGLAAPVPVTAIRLPAAGRVIISLVSASSSCGSSLGIWQDGPFQLFPNSHAVGARAEIGRHAAGEQLLFYETQQPPCGSTTYFSTDLERAHVTQVCVNRWRIGWEDFNDADFDDAVLIVDLVP